VRLQIQTTTFPINALHGDISIANSWVVFSGEFQQIAATGPVAQTTIGFGDCGHEKTEEE
jgi:hypothetical protein